MSRLLDAFLGAAAKRTAPSPGVRPRRKPGSMTVGATVATPSGRRAKILGMHNSNGRPVAELIYTDDADKVALALCLLKVIE